MELNNEEVNLLRSAFACRIEDLKKKIQMCVGELYPRIMSGEILQLGELFKKLTGEEL